MKIEKIKNGYLVMDRYGDQEFCETIQDLFKHLLLALEGRSHWFGGNSFGQVFVASEPGQEFKASKECDPV